MKIKICGITNFADAQAAIDAGADLLGFNFYTKSPRFIDPVSAARLVQSIRSRYAAVQMVGVFVNSPPEHILTILDTCGLDLAQLSGDEPPQTLAGLNDRAFKALRLKNTADLAQSTRRYRPNGGAPAYLVDAYRPGEFGGTGQTADWSLARSLAKAHPILLAGGLTPENVAGAIRQVHPWGVDVASGVEISPGRKDSARLADFIKIAKETELREEVTR
jgi:phosphoribosylanthranilate isomerase